MDQIQSDRNSDTHPYAEAQELEVGLKKQAQQEKGMLLLSE